MLKTNLKKLMQQRGISSAELSRRTHVPKQTICDWLSGVPPENIQQLKVVGNFLNHSVDELCFTNFAHGENHDALIADDLDCSQSHSESVLTTPNSDINLPVISLRAGLMDLLNQRKWSCSELSRRTGVPKQTLHNWLKGRVPRRIEQIKQVANVFEITVDDLCFRDPSLAVLVQDGVEIRRA